MFNECLRLHVPSTSHRVAFGRAVLSMHSTPTSIDCGFGLVQWLIFAQRVNPLSLCLCSHRQLVFCLCVGGKQIFCEEWRVLLNNLAGLTDALNQALAEDHTKQQLNEMRFRSSLTDHRSQMSHANSQQCHPLVSSSSLSSSFSYEGIETFVRVR